MGFILGIINLDGCSVSLEDLGKLSAAVKWDNFKETLETSENWGLGYAHHPDRISNVALFKSEELILLGDIQIYNESSLREFVDFKTPLEGFAQAYRKWGISCANHINGEFSVALIDRKNGTTHLFRDHIGACPLTYWFNQKRLIFASHEFGLVKSGLLSTALNESKLIQRLFRFNEKYTQTVFEDVFKVIPGHSVSFSLNAKKVKKYWEPKRIIQNKNLSFDQAVARLRELLVNATVNRIEPGKTGVHVSGGIDSTGVASILADHCVDKANLIGYSWSPEEFHGEYEGVNEKEFIDLFSEETGIPIRYNKIVLDEVIRDSLLPEFEQMYIEHPTMKQAGSDGVTTLFSGWGGDEFVSLSARGIYNHLFFSLKWNSLGKLFRTWGIKSGFRYLRIEVMPLLIPFGLLKTYQSTDWSNLRILKSSFIRKHWRLIFFHKRKNFFGYGNRTRFMLNLLENYHIPLRMDNWAYHAERYGFAYKYPLLDKDVLEFWFSIPIEYTYRDMHPRLLYREAMKGILTEAIRLRKDKSEDLLLADTIQNRQNGIRVLENTLLSIPKNYHLPFFKPDELLKVLRQEPENKRIKEVLRLNKPILYLRYQALMTTYLAQPSDLTNTR